MQKVEFMPVPATALANAYYRHVASLFPFFMLIFRFSSDQRNNKVLALFE